MTAAGSPPRRWSQAARELAFVLSAALTYLVVRGWTGGSSARAERNADLIVRLERALGIFRERDLQQLVVDHGRLVTFANWVYIWGYWPVIASVAAWLYWRWPATYVLFRNAFLISGAVGLVIFIVFPVAPPRLMDLGFVDTVTEHSHAYRVLQPPALVNQYAAMPSFHFGWLVLPGIALNRESRRVAVRLFGWLMPAAMGLAIVVTGNHYILDAAAGAALSLAGLALSRRLALLRASGRPGQRLGRAPGPT